MFFKRAEQRAIKRKLREVKKLTFCIREKHGQLVSPGYDACEEIAKCFSSYLLAPSPTVTGL